MTDTPSELEKVEYHAPRLQDYGEIKKATNNIAGPGVGCDGSYPSYTTS